MKKVFFILLCVSTCLSALAAMPLTNQTAQRVSKRPSSTLAKKSDIRTNLLAAPVMSVDKNVLTPNQFFTERGTTPNDNLLMKRAPRRMTAADVASTKIAFMESFEYNPDSDKVVRSKCYYDGGWDVTMEEWGDGVYGAYLYYDQIPVMINVDYNSRAAEMVMDYIAGWQWSDTIKAGTTTTINDTTEYMFVIDESYMMDYDATDFTNIAGTIYDDGSIHFEDGFCFVFMDYVTKTVTRNGRTTVTNDTVMMTTPFYRDTYLMTPSATHDSKYDYTMGNKTYTEDLSYNVYMFQYDDSTAVVWNLWGLGGRGTYMYINGDGELTMPSYQVAGTWDVSDYEEAYPEYDWSEGYECVIVGYDMENDDYDLDDIKGIATPEQLSWGGIMLWSYCVYNGAYYVLPSGPLYDNVLTFTNGDYFLLGHTATPVISSVIDDESVTVTATVEAEDDAAVALFIWEGSNTTAINNPYTVARTGEDQSITFVALAQERGKNVSDAVFATITIPGLYVLGDVNGDKVVNISDVVLLIDVVLEGSFDDIDAAAADINQDACININDVVALIDMILNGE